MAIQILLGDLDGKVLAELTADVGPVSWQLNKPGKMKLTLPKPIPFKIGYRILVRFDNGLPDWGGTVELPWTETPGTIEATCLGIENALLYRRTRKNRNFYSAPVGAIFQALILEAQTYQSLGINLGHVWNGGGAHSPRYHFKPVLDVLQKSICAMEACDFALIPKLTGGKITFTGELYFQRGVDKTSSVVLLEDNLSDVVMKWNGSLVNNFAAVGNGSTWGNERPVSIQEDSASVNEYGLREDSGAYTGVTYSTTLETHAKTILKQRAFPRRKVSFDAANLAPSSFSSYDIGDIVRLSLPSFGYDAPVRLLAREFDPGTGKCSLVVEEPTESVPTSVPDEDVE